MTCEKQLEEINRLTDLVWNLPVNEIPVAYVRDIHDIIHDWEEYQRSPTTKYTGERTNG